MKKPAKYTDLRWEKHGKKPKMPEWGSDQTIAEFWGTHDIADYWDELEVANDVKFAKPKKEVVSIRLEPIYRQQLNALARNRSPYNHKAVNTLISILWLYSQPLLW